MRTLLRLAPATLALFLVSASPVAADGFFTPYTGVTFGGDSADGKVAFGGALGFMGAGIFGFEVDLGYSPDFLDADRDIDFDGDSNVTTLMVNALLGAPFGGTGGGGARPYASAGVGLLRARVTSSRNLFDDITRNDLGVNVGAGIMAFFGDHLGLRGDVRYFRSLTEDDTETFGVDLGGFDFMRGTVGLVVRF